MTSDMTQKRKPTWNRIGALTLVILVLSVLVGLWMMGHRFFLAPPMAASTPYFYMVVGLLPALITFLIGAWARPTGKRTMLLALPIFGSLIFVFYLVLIGPGFYTNIQCQVASGSKLVRHLDCNCLLETSSGKGQVKCSADQLVTLPVIRLVEEKRGVP